MNTPKQIIDVHVTFVRTDHLLNHPFTHTGERIMFRHCRLYAELIEARFIHAFAHVVDGSRSF